MSDMKKKIVFLPYDFDTAIGTNNEGSLVFGYSLEDIDQVGGANVFNGQDSVLWTLLRDQFYPELKEMYKQLRSQGKLSYAGIEKAFEDHQAVWPEALFNEDAYYKYLAPLVESGSEAYLSMLQGSKAEQRKWWLYNRFRYMDSKYNAGDALTDVITLRGYAKANVTLTPYADIYPTVKFGSYLVQCRGVRNTAYTLVCPLDTVNDTEIYIYSASQLADIGDLSGLKVGYAEFVYATRIGTLKVGSNATGYTNPNLLTLYPGNSKLLKIVDARNCTNFGTGEQKNLDLSGCSNIEEVYLDGTAVLGCSLPNGGYLKKLHLPGTITNLTILNQGGITEFVCPDYSHITTLNLEATSSAVDIADIAADIATGCRVRLFNFYWSFEDLDDAWYFMELFDGCTGIDEHGQTVATPQIFATIHVPSATGDDIAAFRAAYPDITLVADTVTYWVKYYSWDGLTLLNTETVASGGTAVGYTEPSRTSTAQYDYTAVGWSFDMDSQTASSGALDNVTANRTLYAAYSRTLRSYTIAFVNALVDGGQTLQSSSVPYGTTPSYTGSTPTSTRPYYEFESWTPTIVPVTGDATYTAVYENTGVTITYMNGDVVFATETLARGGNGNGPSTNPTKSPTPQYIYTFAGWNANSSASSPDPDALKNVQADRTVYAIYTETVQTYTITYVRAAEDGGGTLQTLTNVAYGTIPLYTGATPTSTRPDYVFKGWTPAVAPVTGDQTYTAVFADSSSQTRKVINRTIVNAEDDELMAVGDNAFRLCYSLKTASFASATYIGSMAFAYCSSLTTMYFPAVTSIGQSAFAGCAKLQTASFSACTNIGSNAFQNCTSLTTASFSACQSIGYAAFSGCTYLTNVSFPVAISISANAFANCRSLTTVSFPVATSINNGIFSGCSKLTTASFTVATSIGDNMFANCQRLTTVSFPVATRIGSNAFQNCYSLTTVSFPSVTSIGNYAFQNCISLTTVSFPAVTSIGSSAFQNCSSLVTASFPSVKNIYSNAFSNCYNLTTISFPAATNISGGAFYCCSNLITASFPSVTSIGNYAFCSCSKLTTASFPVVTSIGGSAFQNCYDLINVFFPAAKTIVGNTFQSCSNLTSVSFPACTSIGGNTFANCSNLTTTIFGNESSIVYLGNSNAFNGTHSTLAIYVPDALVTNYKVATNWSFYSSRIKGISELPS